MRLRCLAPLNEYKTICHFNNEGLKLDRIKSIKFSTNMKGSLRSSRSSQNSRFGDFVDLDEEEVAKERVGYGPHIDPSFVDSTRWSLSRDSINSRSNLGIISDVGTLGLTARSSRVSMNEKQSAYPAIQVCDESCYC